MGDQVFKDYSGQKMWFDYKILFYYSSLGDWPWKRFEQMT